MTMIALGGDDFEMPPLQPKDYSMNLQELQAELRRAFSENIPAIEEAIAFQQNPELAQLLNEVKKVLEQENFDDFSLASLNNVAQQFAEHQVMQERQLEQIQQLTQNMSQPGMGNGFE